MDDNDDEMSVSINDLIILLTGKKKTKQSFSTPPKNEL